MAAACIAAAAARMVAPEGRDGAVVQGLSRCILAIPWSGCQSFSTPCVAMLAPTLSSALSGFHHTYEFDAADQKRTHSDPDGPAPPEATDGGADAVVKAPGLEAFLVVVGGVASAGTGGVFGSASGGVSGAAGADVRRDAILVDAPSSAAGWLGGAEGDRPAGSERDVDGRPVERPAPPPLPLLLAATATLPPRVRGIEGGPGLGRRELILTFAGPGCTPWRKYRLEGRDSSGPASAFSTWKLAASSGGASRRERPRHAGQPARVGSRAGCATGPCLLVAGGKKALKNTTTACGWTSRHFTENSRLANPALGAALGRAGGVFTSAVGAKLAKTNSSMAGGSRGRASEGNRRGRPRGGGSQPGGVRNYGGNEAASSATTPPPTDDDVS